MIPSSILGSNHCQPSQRETHTLELGWKVPALLHRDVAVVRGVCHTLLCKTFFARSLSFVRALSVCVVTNVRWFSIPAIQVTIASLSACNCSCRSLFFFIFSARALVSTSSLSAFSFITPCYSMHRVTTDSRRTCRLAISSIHLLFSSSIVAFIACRPSTV